MNQNNVNGNDSQLTGRITLVAGISLMLCLLAVTVTMCLLIIRDGNTPLVQQAMNLMQQLLQFALPVVAGIVLGSKGIDAALGYLQSKVTANTVTSVAPVQPALAGSIAGVLAPIAPIAPASAEPVSSPAGVSPAANAVDGEGL